jgi:pimeloyl-ACP methyl ester carboxylesterase
LAVTTAVEHRRRQIDGMSVFYREAGSPDAPTVLLLHGYPCSSYQFRHLMPLLADRWHLLAPDFPGFGYSDTPSELTYDFDSYTHFLERFIDTLRIERFALYLHDFSASIGLRLALRRSERVAALIVQNGTIYTEVLGPKYAALQTYFDAPTPERRARLIAAMNEDGFEEEFLNDVSPELASRIPPDLWKLHASLLTTRRREIAADLMVGLRDNLAWFPTYQTYLQEQQPATLILWGLHDAYATEDAARAYLRDLPAAELQVLDGGHWLLETHLTEVAAPLRSFLSRQRW